MLLLNLQCKSRLVENPQFILKSQQSQNDMLFEDFHTPITQSFYQIGKQYEKSPLSYTNAVNDIYPGFAVNNRYSRLKLGLLDKETKDSQAISIKFLYFEHYYKKAAIEILKILY